MNHYFSKMTIYVALYFEIGLSFYMLEGLKVSSFLNYLAVLMKFKMKISVFDAVLLSYEYCFYQSIIMCSQIFRFKNHLDYGAKRAFFTKIKATLVAYPFCLSHLSKLHFYKPLFYCRFI